MRIRAFVLPFLLLAGCASAGAPASSPATGSWTLHTVNGAALPAESPGEAGVTIEASSLELRADGGYTFDVTGRVGRWGTAQLHRTFGRYRLGASALVLEPRVELADPVRFTWRVQGGMLHLRDEQGAEYVFERR